MKTFFIAFRVTLVTLILTGVLYPLGITLMAQVFFPEDANGSMVRDESGKVIGSRLLAQAFQHPGYFQPRPSTAGYDPLASGGSNLGATSAKLQDRFMTEFTRLQSANPEAHRPIPIELLTASASGLDPHLSIAAAEWQVPRVARARGVNPTRIRAALGESIIGRDLGVLGEQTVNVLELNLMLNRQFGKVTRLH